MDHILLWYRVDVNTFGEVIMSSDFTKISTKIYLLRAEEGGRKTPIFTGYRPTMYFGDRQTDGLIVFDREEKPTLGGEYTVTISLAHPEYLGDVLQADAIFDFREGSKIIGYGKILSIEETKS
jgi:translation elongation factor EF-Tu-like GTPase